VGYWWPPAPECFDPVPRPLRWEGSRQSPIPSVEDCTIFGIGEGEFPGHADQWGRPYASGTLVFGGRAYGKPARVANFMREGKTVTDRLDTYRRLIDLRTPDDPKNGGLCADTIDYLNGSFQVNYWDFSDDTQPRRKRITFTPRGNDVKKTIEQWEGDWRPEGDDAEKGFIEALPSIIAGFGAVTTIAIGYLTGNPSLAAAWTNVFKMASSPVFGGPAPSIEGFASAAVATLGAAPDFGKVMGNLFTEKALKSGIFGEIGQINFAQISQYGQDASSHLDKLKAVAMKFANAMPRIDVDLMRMFNVTTGAVDGYAMLQGKAPSIGLPEDIVRAFQNSLKGLSTFDLDSFGKAGVAFSLNLGQDLYYSIRKAADDKSTFEATFASLVAMKDKPVDQRFLASTADDPTATATVAQVLARGKQSASVASDASRTWRQALADTQAQAPVIQPSKQAPVIQPSKTASNAVGAALAMLVLYRLFRMVRP
jgi:hypothetical protein